MWVTLWIENSWKPVCVTEAGSRRARLQVLPAFIGRYGGQVRYFGCSLLFEFGEHTRAGRLLIVDDDAV